MSIIDRRRKSDFTHIGLTQYPALNDGVELHSFVGRRQEDKLLADSLRELAKITCDAIEGAVSTGILLHGTLGHSGAAAISGEDVQAVDAAQFEHRIGPCLDAIHQNRIVRLDDIQESSGQYPEFSSAALRGGLLSALSLPLVIDNENVGVVNVYAESVRGFSVEDEEFASSIATLANTALSLDKERSNVKTSEPAAKLRDAMNSRARVEQAKGIYMARSRDLTSDDAFNLISTEAQLEGTDLDEIAARVIEDSFTATIEHEDSRLTVHLSGELDTSTQPTLMRTLCNAMMEATDTVYLDVKGLTFVDAFGIGTLVSTRNSLHAESRQLVIVNAPPNVAKLIAVSGLSELMAPG